MPEICDFYCIQAYFVTSADAEASSPGLCQVEQVDRVLPGIQHARRHHSRGHGQVGVARTQGQRIVKLQLICMTVYTVIVAEC